MSPTTTAQDKAQLLQQLAELRREHFNLRMQLQLKQLAKPSELRRVRHEVARVLTKLNARDAR